MHHVYKQLKGKVLPYSLLSVGPGADPGVQAVSPQVTWSHPPGVRLLLLSARPAITFPAEERHRLSVGTKLYCLVTEAHACKQLAQCCYLEVDWPRFKPATFGSRANALPLSHTGHKQLLHHKLEGQCTLLRCSQRWAWTRSMCLFRHR